MNWKQTAVSIVCIAVICAGLVWFLEEFNRQRMVSEWREFVDTWEKGARGGAAGE